MDLSLAARERTAQPQPTCSNDLERGQIAAWRTQHAGFQTVIMAATECERFLPFKDTLYRFPNFLNRAISGPVNT